MAEPTAMRAAFACTDEDYDRLGLNRDKVEAWEDGLRTDGSSGDYEWWYFDSHLEGGANLVLAIHSKEDMKAELPEFEPFATFEFNTADGRSYTERVDFTAQEFFTSTERCDIRVENSEGKCAFVGDLHEYHITFENENAKADVRLKGTVPSWRTQSGIIEYADGSQKFGWIVAIPNGDVVADIEVDGQHYHLTGTGYHDHNWGNVSMLAVHHDWYWGRCQVGGYNIISAYITEDRAFGYAELPEFMLVDPAGRLYDDPNKVTYEVSDPVVDEDTGQTIHNRVFYGYEDASSGTRFEITYLRDKTIVARKLVDQLPEEMRPAIIATGFDGAYIRFSGKVELKRFENDSLVEEKVADAVWERMYFGDMPTPP